MDWSTTEWTFAQEWGNSAHQYPDRNLLPSFSGIRRLPLGTQTSCPMIVCSLICSDQPAFGSWADRSSSRRWSSFEWRPAQSSQVPKRHSEQRLAWSKPLYLLRPCWPTAPAPRSFCPLMSHLILYRLGTFLIRRLPLGKRLRSVRQGPVAGGHISSSIGLWKNHRSRVGFLAADTLPSDCRRTVYPVCFDRTCSHCLCTNQMSPLSWAARLTSQVPHWPR